MNILLLLLLLLLLNVFVN